MAKVGIELRKNYTSKEGKHPLSLRISKGNKKKYISLGLFATKKQWDSKSSQFVKDKRLNPNYITDNNFINEQISKALNIFAEFERNNIDCTLNQFEDKFFAYAKRGNVKEYFEGLIKDLADTEHTGNARVYQKTMGMLMSFDAKFSERVFSEIDLKYIKKFDLFLQKPRISIMRYESGKTRYIERKGCRGNTRHYYMKTLKALLNRAIKDKEASRGTYPFGEDGFQVGSLAEETVKRYLPTDHLVKMVNHIPQKRTTNIGKLLFLFSYYSYGMSFIDMANLTTDNIKYLEGGNFIVYKRYKTRHNKKARHLFIQITPAIQDIIDELKECQAPLDNYLLPIVTDHKPTDKGRYEHIRNMLKKYNNYLKALSKEVGIKDMINMTSYVSRHTMAMSLQHNYISREIISQMMGHNKLETTATYLDNFANQEISKAASVLYLQ